MRGFVGASISLPLTLVTGVLGCFMVTEAPCAVYYGEITGCGRASVFNE
jgi:hypothetical protein